MRLYGAGGVLYRFGAVTPDPQPGEIARERLALAVGPEGGENPALRDIDERVAVARLDTPAGGRATEGAEGERHEPGERLCPVLKLDGEASPAPCQRERHAGPCAGMEIGVSRSRKPCAD